MRTRIRILIKLTVKRWRVCFFSSFLFFSFSPFLLIVRHLAPRTINGYIALKIRTALSYTAVNKVKRVVPVLSRISISLTFFSKPARLIFPSRSSARVTLSRRPSFEFSSIFPGGRSDGGPTETFARRPFLRNREYRFCVVLEICLLRSFVLVVVVVGTKLRRFTSSSVHRPL